MKSPLFALGLLLAACSPLAAQPLVEVTVVPNKATPADLKPDDPYAAIVEEQDRREHLALPEATLMAEIFSCLWEGAPGLIGQRLEDFGVSARDKVSPMSDLDLGKIYGWYAGGFLAFVVFLGILEKIGIPNKILGYLFVFFTIAGGSVIVCSF